MKHPGRVIGLILLAVFVTFAVVKLKAGFTPKQMRRASIPNVHVETPHIETIKSTLEFTGDIDPNRKVGIFARVGGNLENVLVQVGDWVQTGQLLAQIDTTEIYQELILFSATYHNIKTILDRNQELAAKNLISTQELDNSRASMEIAQANYEASKLRMRHTSITAPFNGIITERFFDPGALVNANNAVLFTLVDFQTVKVMVDVLEKDIPKIRKGAQAFLTVDAYPGDVFEGVLKRFSESLDVRTRTMNVEVDVPNHDHRLKPGMFGTVHVVLDTHPNAITIPSSIILKDAVGYFLWVVHDGKSLRKNVDVGWNQNERTEILAGLSIKDSIITVGTQSLRDSGSVNISQR